ncbi:MAG: hypothetical protein GF417_04335 [Candidatus Latescibacteria bacterium]|nr:hypothetical protein [bacterium]MBD3423654.1 hypothetical protein [Candidatus Latescibacterota bacterium]
MVKKTRCSLNVQLILFIFITLMISLPEGADAGDQFFEISELGVADHMLDIHVEDLDRDGLKDIMITHTKGLSPNQTRWISIFHQSSDSRFYSAADQSWQIDSSAVIMDTGDVAGDNKIEIVYFTDRLIRYYSIGDDFYYKTEPSNLLEVSGMTIFPEKDDIPIIDFVRDWSGDGSDDIAAFRFKGLSIFASDSSGTFRRYNDIPVEVESSVGGNISRDYPFRTEGLSAHFYFPDLNLIDYNNDGRSDLLITREDRLYIYLKDENNMFSSKLELYRNFDVRTKKEKIEAMANVYTTIQNLDHDGYADVIVTKQTAKGITDLRGVLNIYNGGEKGYGAKPDQVIISEGTASAGTTIRDVNGDGKMDLILPSVKISVTALIRFLITRSFPIKFNIFLYHEDGRFSESPDFSKEVKFKIDFSGESDTQAINLKGDFNNDRRKDFVFATDDDELSIYLGIRGDDDRIFSDDRAAEIDILAFGEIEVDDLDGDGYSDMLMYYPQNREMEGKVNVLLNLRRIGRD